MSQTLPTHFLKCVLEELKSDNKALYLCTLIAPKKFMQARLLHCAIYAKLIKILRLNADPIIVCLRLQWWQTNIATIEKSTDTPLLHFLKTRTDYTHLCRIYADIFANGQEYIQSLEKTKYDSVSSIFLPLFIHDPSFKTNGENHKDVTTLCVHNYANYCLGIKTDPAIITETLARLKLLYRQNRVSKEYYKLCVTHFISLKTRNPLTIMLYSLLAR